MNESQHPAIGSTLTAAQANSLPVGSRVTRKTWPPGVFWERTSHGWIDERGRTTGDLSLDDYTLMRVSPSPTFTVGQVVTAAECNELPDDAVVRCHEHGDEFKRIGGRWLYDGVDCDVKPEAHREPFTIISLPSPACPHAEGSWEWAKAQMAEGKCVKAVGWCEKRLIDGAQHYWQFPDGPWSTDGNTHTDKDWSRVTDWRIVPDPSLPEPPKEGTWEWAKAQMAEGKCVKAVGWCEKRLIDGAQHYWQFPNGPWSTDGNIHTDKDWSRVTDWRIVPDPSLPAETPVQGESATNEQLLAQMLTLKGERDNYAAEIAALAIRVEQEKHRADSLTAERDTALARAEKAEMECGILEEAIAQRDAELATARVVVPERVREAVDWTIAYCDKESCEGRMARFILSLADHIPAPAKMVQPDHIASVGKMVQSAHPEGSREWAGDAMRQGYAVAHKDQNDGSFWKDFKCVSCDEDNGQPWGALRKIPTGWRIHTPAPLPALSLDSLDARLKAVETRAKGGGE